VSTRTRAEVIAELRQAAANGQIARNTEAVDQSNFVSTKTRGQVRTEVIQATKSKVASIGG
ncbi:MAG TPA: DUF4148 domain-containing protein, partial [Oxalobacteraceae bacterium]|nr:DUF4148 domain-containing protein [Oxalobacteraceae bacterium]